MADRVLSDLSADEVKTLLDNAQKAFEKCREKHGDKLTEQNYQDLRLLTFGVLAANRLPRNMRG